MTDDVANALPAYEVGGELGRGAYGRVLQGRHRQLGRVVAIKQLDAALADDATYRAAFLREAQVVADLSHPHVVQVYDFVDHDGLLLLVMEYLDRGSLADAHRRGEMTHETACGAVMAACSGVQFVHERGVLHRDLKPENLMLDTQGTMKVTDFGLARADTDVRRTRRGDLLGSPAYMAPEQAAGGEVGRSADVYTLGVSLYYLLSGAFPHDVEGGTMAVLQRRLTEPPRPLAAVAPDVPEPLAEVVMAALAEDPEARPASAELLGQGLGAAAWEAWGPSWIDRSDVKVRAPGRVLTASDSPPSPSWRQELLAPSADTATATVDTRAAVAPAPTPVAPGRRSRRGLIIAAVLAGVALLVLAVVVVVTRDSGDHQVALTQPVFTVPAAWTFPTEDQVFATATASGPNAIVGSMDGTVYALDANDGHEVWRAVTKGPVRSSAAVEGDRAYMGSFDGNLYALDTATGAEVWRASTGYQIVSSPAVAGGLVVVGSGNLLRAFDGTTGAPRWVFDTSQSVVSSPTIAGSTVFVGADDGNVYAVGLDGTERWRYPTGGEVRSSPVVADGVVYVGSKDGSLYALDAGSGALRWSVPLGSAVYSSPAVASQTVIVGLSGGALVALDAASGDERWRAQLNGAVDSSPLVDANDVIVGSNDRALHAFVLSTGVERWQMSTGDVVFSSPVLVAGTIVVGSNDGKVYGARP